MKERQVVKVLSQVLLLFASPRWKMEDARRKDPEQI
jgi:hypothetical protein